jgi:hypothetical protein
MTWELGGAACQSAAITPGLYQAFGPLKLWRVIYRVHETAEPGICVQFKDMARRFGQLALALLHCSAILANTPVDPALKPCGDAYYYPSKVHRVSNWFTSVLIVCSTPAMNRTFSARS